MIATLTKKFFEKLKRKDYRDAYVAENVAMLIAHQIRALREQRGWTQRKFAEELGSHASVVNRYEDPDYGKLTVQTLLDLARVFDLGLIIRFTGFPEFIFRTRDVSPEALQAASFDEKQFAISYASVSGVGLRNIKGHNKKSYIPTPIKTKGGVIDWHRLQATAT